MGSLGLSHALLVAWGSWTVGLVVFVLQLPGGFGASLVAAVAVPLAVELVALAIAAPTVAAASWSSETRPVFEVTAPVRFFILFIESAVTKLPLLGPIAAFIYRLRGSTSDRTTQVSGSSCYTYRVNLGAAARPLGNYYVGCALTIHATLALAVACRLEPL